MSETKNIVEKLKEHLRNYSKEDIEKQCGKYANLDSVGMTLDEFLNINKFHKGEEDLI